MQLYRAAERMVVRYAEKFQPEIKTPVSDEDHA